MDLISLVPKNVSKMMSVAPTYLPTNNLNITTIPHREIQLQNLNAWLDEDKTKSGNIMEAIQNHVGAALYAKETKENTEKDVPSVTLPSCAFPAYRSYQANHIPR